MVNIFDERPFIFVLAGVNGAGKSSVGGHLLREVNLIWYNPDSFARELMNIASLTLEEANSQAWEFERKQLENAIKLGLNFAFETTLGANTMPNMLIEATQTHNVIVWFCGLSSPEQHIARVNYRVNCGGHVISEQKIRERWVSSRTNLILLLPYISYLQVFDNSVEAIPNKDIPAPILVLEMQSGRILFPNTDHAEALIKIPDWAKPIIQAATELS